MKVLATKRLLELVKLYKIHKRSFIIRKAKNIMSNDAGDVIGCGLEKPRPEACRGPITLRQEERGSPKLNLKCSLKIA